MDTRRREQAGGSTGRPAAAPPYQSQCRRRGGRGTGVGALIHVLPGATQEEWKIHDLTGGHMYVKEVQDDVAVVDGEL